MLRFCDSFDHYTPSSSVFTKWTGPNTSCTVSQTTGRTGVGQALDFGSNTGNAHARMSWQSSDNQAKWVVGFAWNPSDSSVPIMAFFDGGTGQIYLDVSSGQLRLWRGVDVTVLGVGTTQCIIDGWQYIEVEAVIDNTTGSVTVKKNGVTEITFSGDTSQTGNAYANILSIYARNSAPFTSGSSRARFDDLYLLDGQGSQNTFLGDVAVEALFPNGNGNSSQFLGSDSNSTDNYLLVDETAPNGDTDYVASSTVSEKDTYAFSNLAATTGNVAGVQILSYSRKQGTGSRQIAHVARLSGTEVDSSNIALADSYAYYASIMETKPGGGAWSRTDVNSAEFGVKVTV